MTDTVLPNKQLTEPQVGGDLNNWGDILNTNLANTDKAFGGYNTLTDTGGTVNMVPAQYIPVSWVISGTLVSNLTYVLPSGVGGMWTVYNAITNPSSNFTVTVASAGSPGAASAVLPPGFRSLIVSDGAGNVQFADNGPQAQGFVTLTSTSVNPTATADCFWTVSDGIATLRIGNMTGVLLSQPFTITGFPPEVQPARYESCIVYAQTATGPVLTTALFTISGTSDPVPYAATLGPTDGSGFTLGNVCGLYEGNTIIYPLDTNIYKP
jgi:hypothetical protein